MTNSNVEKNENAKNKKSSRGKDYIVKRVFVGDKDLKTIIWNIAERKALREMGLII